MRFSVYRKRLAEMSDEALVNELRVLSGLEKTYMSSYAEGKREVTRLRGRLRLLEEEISRRRTRKKSKS